MASTVFELTIRVIVFTLMIASATLPAGADQEPCNAVTTCRFGKQKLIIKTTVTPSAYNESKTAAYYSKYELEVRNNIAIKRLNDDMEIATSESTRTAARCSFEESAAVDLGALLDAGEGALVTLVAGETRLAAHRAVLAARSPVFASMLCDGTQDAGSGQVVVTDVEGAVLRQLLAYLYTQQAPQLPGMAAQLLAAADTFGLSALKSTCEMQAAAQLTVETAVDTAVLAIKHSSTSLMQAAIAFIRAHLVQVLGTKGWGHAARYQIEYFVELNRLLAESPAETSTPAAAGSQPTSEAQSRTPSSQAQTPVTAASTSQPTSEASPATAAPPSPACPPPDDDAVSRLRVLSAEEKGRRLVEEARNGTVGEIAALLAAGADVETRDGVGRTALHRATERRHVEAVRCLLARGAQVNVSDMWQVTPLHLTVSSGPTTVMRLLLAASADPNAKGHKGLLPLHSAAMHGHAAVVQLLVAAKADVEARWYNDWTALHIAAAYNEPEVAAALVEAGADKGARDDKGRTPLDIATANNKPQKLIDILK